MRLSEWPLPCVRFACRTCGKDVSFEREDLLAVGGDGPMRQVWGDVAGDCALGDVSVCGLVLADALLVDAILEEDEGRVADPSLLPQAREWRAKRRLRAA